MEGRKFLRLIKKHRMTLIVVPILVSCIAWVLLRNSPETFTSRATLSTGIVDQSQQLLTDKDLLQESKTTQEFSNMIQMLQMKKIIDQISYKLILHDLQDTVPFRKPSKLLKQLNMDARKHVVNVLDSMYECRDALSALDDDQRGMIDVIASMGYDKESIGKKLKIYRLENSDFVVLEYESESPVLSTYIVNTLCSEFINFYAQLTKENEHKTIIFLDTLLAEKRDSMYRHMNSLRNYKQANHVLDIDEQVKVLYGQISDFESKIQLEQKNIEATEGAIKSLKQKFSESDTAYFEAREAQMNRQIVKTKQQLNDLNDAYIKSGFDPALKAKLDSIREVLTQEVNTTTDKHILNPVTIKDNLLAQKLNLEINRDLALNSLRALKNEQDKLDRKFIALVPNQTKIETYKGDLDLANKEYSDILNKYNQSSMEYNTNIKLKVIETATPGKGQASKKMLLVIVSGLGSFVFCMLILFILFYLDESISSPQELADKTGIPVLGYVPLLLDLSVLDFEKFWSNKAISPSATEYKNQLRSARFEIDNIIHTPKLLNITSLKESEGKTLFAICLASAYLMISKKVLLIDGNFAHSSITEYLKPDYYLEDYLKGTSSIPEPTYHNDFVVMGNRGNDVSLFEITDEATIRQKIKALKDEFDVIFIESSALDTLNKSKEWNTVVDHVLTVYEAELALNNMDKQNLEYLKNLKGQFIGWVLNRVTFINNKPKSRKRAK